MTDELRILWYGVKKKQVLNIRYMRRTPRCGSPELNGPGAARASQAHNTPPTSHAIHHIAQTFKNIR